MEMEIQKLIPRGRILNLLGNKILVPFTYKKLQRIFFNCENISHGEQGCHYRDYKANEQHGTRLRAESMRRPTGEKMVDKINQRLAQDLLK